MSNTDPVEVFSQAPTQNSNNGTVWAGLFDTIGGLGTSYFNSKSGYPSGSPGSYNTPLPIQNNNNTILFVIGGIILIAIILSRK